jgi:hypothetical protein
MPSRLRSLIVSGELFAWATGFLVLVGIAVFTYGHGVADWRYQLADLKEDPLYLRGPGPSVIVGIVISAVVSVMAPSITADARRIWPSPTRTGGGLRWHWWWLLIAGWGGYIAGIGVVTAGGGPILRPGTMRLELGAPLGTVFDVPATCETVPGKPAVVASIVADDDRLPPLEVLDRVTGAPRWDGLAYFDLAWTGRRQPVPIPDIPDRPPIYQLDLVANPKTGDLRIEAEAIPFLRAYSYQSVDNQVSGGSGTARFLAGRWRDSRYRDLIVDDPWPESYGLTVRWTCDLGAVAPAAAQTPRQSLPVLPPGPSRIPTPVPPAGVPVTIQLTSGSELLTVGVRGATVASVEDPIVSGDARASYADGTFRLEQALDAAEAGRVVDATFRFELRDATAGTMIFLPTTHGSVGTFAVTVYNDLAPEPVPVCIPNEYGFWRESGRPGDCRAAFLVGPVRWVAVP